MLASALEYICRFIEWPAAHAHIVGGERLARRMWPSNIWYADPALDVAPLQTATAEYVSPKVKACRARSGIRPAPSGLTTSRTARISPQRKRPGHRSALRLRRSAPDRIRSGCRPGFFGPNPTPEDPALLDMLGKAGTQLGRVIERDQANARLLDPMHDALTGLPSRRFSCGMSNRLCANTRSTTGEGSASFSSTWTGSSCW